MNSTKKIAVFGCKSTTQFILEALQEKYSVDCLISIDREKGQHMKVADYQDLQAYAGSQGIDFYQAKKYSLKSEEDHSFLAERKIDIAFVVGWQRLIPENILKTFSTGAFGMHGSAMNLPLGRGRSPMNWSIIEGKKMFYTNLFKYDEGVDSGSVLDSYKFSINEYDTGETMHFKNTLSMKHLILKNMDRLISGNFSLEKQPDIPASYYPKRTETDSLIEWGEDMYQIERFIRAVAPPFNGAYTFLNGNKIRILRANVFDHQDFGYSQETSGKILEVFPNGKFLVKCYGGLLLVHEFEGKASPEKGEILNQGLEEKKVFPRNAFGGFDIYENE